MIMNPFSILASTTLIVSTMMVLSSTNWMFLWIAIELNLLSFIPLMMSTNTFQETEAAVKYFLVQGLGSSLMLMSSMCLWFSSTTPVNMMSIILLMSMILKIGMAPCHMWYSSVMTSISWTMALILSTWQKLAPLSIMSFIISSTNSSLMMLIAGMNALIGGVMGLNQSHLRTIMAYSSITHMGWMMALIYMNKSFTTIMYFMMYSLIISPMFIMMNQYSTASNSYVSKMLLISPYTQILIPLILLSLGGLPPLTGFLPKWMTIVAIAPNNPLLLMVLIMGSMMNMYYYLNIIFAIMLSSNMVNKSMNSNIHYSISSMLVAATCALFLAPTLFLL